MTYLCSVLVNLGIPVFFTAWLIHTLHKDDIGITGLDGGSVATWRWVFAVVVPLCIVCYSIPRKSLTTSGILLTLVVCFVTTLCTPCFSMAIVSFFIAGSKATTYRAIQKKSIEENYKKGGQRNWLQVYCNGGIATHLALIYMADSGCVETPIDFKSQNNSSWLAMAVMGSVACCSGDTFASEFGTVIGGGKPRLVTTLRSVPKGTNGGVSLAGLLCSLLGGLLVGTAYYVTLICLITINGSSAHPSQWPIIVVGGAAGLIGSLVDSYLGATVQFSGFSHKLGCVVEQPGLGVDHICGIPLLNNHSVNLTSSLITAFLTPYLAKFAWTIMT